MPSRQDLVVTQKRAVTKLVFNNESAAYTHGVTGSLFDGIGGSTGEAFVRGITNNTAALSRIVWSCLGATAGYNLTWAGTPGGTAYIAAGVDGDLSFERFTIKNNATNPTGILTITPTATVTGTLILEFVQSSASVTPPGYLSL